MTTGMVNTNDINSKNPKIWPKKGEWWCPTKAGTPRWYSEPFQPFIIRMGKPPVTWGGTGGHFQRKRPSNRHLQKISCSNSRQDHWPNWIVCKKIFHSFSHAWRELPNSLEKLRGRHQPARISQDQPGTHPFSYRRQRPASRASGPVALPWSCWLPPTGNLLRSASQAHSHPAQVGSPATRRVGDFNGNLPDPKQPHLWLRVPSRAGRYSYTWLRWYS